MSDSRQKRFIILVREVHVSHLEVMADNEEDAIRRVRFEGEGEEKLCEYSHTLDSDTWTIEKAKEE